MTEFVITVALLVILGVGFYFCAKWVCEYHRDKDGEGRI